MGISGSKGMKKSPEDLCIIFSHEHTLSHRYVETGTTEEECDVCKKELYGVVYACEVCKFLRHGSCAKEGIPSKFTHPSHSEFHLLMQQDKASDFLCEGCVFNSRGPRYHCNQCNIDFDLACVSSRNDQCTREDSGQIVTAGKPRKRTEHFSHGEPLALFKYRKTTKYYELDCSWCDKRLSGMSYGCFKSANSGCGKFFLHEFCIAKIPQRLNHPFHPGHHLIVQYGHNRYHFPCNACKHPIISPNLLTYYACHECHFCLHISCARLLPTFKHKCHKHSLTYLSRSTKKYFPLSERPQMVFNCNACQQDCNAKKNKEGAFYRCVQCDFNIHFKCLPAPSIAKHRYHRHYLTLHPGVIEDDSGEHYCDICEEERNPKHHIYYCKECTFIAHVECVLKEVSGFKARKMMALLKRVQKSNGKFPNPKEIGAGNKIDRNQLLETQEIHFLLKDLEQENKEKEDWLKYYEKDEDEEEEEDKEETSVQEEDEEDEELENEEDEESEEEDEEKKEENEVNQGEATTSMDGTEDISPHPLTPSEIPALNKIEHFSHFHPLNLFHLAGKYGNGNCNACLQELNGTVYICKTCDFGLHKSCTELPHMLQHPLHSQHSLSLLPRFPHSGTSSFICDECRDFTTGFVYLCLDCRFKLDVKCAVFGAPKIRSQEAEHREKKTKILHFSHEHVLVLGNLVHRSIACAGCNLPTLGPAYCCLDCLHIIHESCLSLLPKTMQHPFHPLHPLAAHPFHPHDPFGGRSYSKECHACKLQFRMGFRTLVGFPTSAFISYGCERCELHLHFVCAHSLRRVLKCSCHAHDLYYFGPDSQLFLEQFRALQQFDFSCNACKETCEGPFYRCVKCAINFHLKCCRVPEMIESKRHIHPLALKDSFVEDSSGEYYCDVCEEERRPKDHVYYCEECEGHFVAHIECVLSLGEKIGAAEEESTDESSEEEEIAEAEGPSSNRVLNSDNAPIQAESEESTDESPDEQQSD